MAASLGQIREAPIKFERSTDVSLGGVLFSLPSLLANGLLYKSERYFNLPSGYYGMESIFIILAFLVLLRVKSLEGVRYLPPGEIGKLVGFDRIPEVKTMRSKVEMLSKGGNVEGWQNELTRKWMESMPELAGYLYVDGHVRVYHGKETKLPRRFVSRERLCLRGMTDYWVNDALGQPFFVVSTPLTSGLLSMLRREIIPQLLEEVPNQPSEEELANDLYLNRFVLLFDREGYSPEFFEEMYLRHRISCITYNKNPGEDWPVEEFEEQEVTLKSGRKEEMVLSERRTSLSDICPLREIRRLSPYGHQTSILSTDFKSRRGEIAGALFSRWSQENFFKYMREHFGIDRLIEYATEKMPETARVVNPHYRKIDSEIKKLNSKRVQHLAHFGSKTLNEIDDPRKVKAYEMDMADLIENILAEEKAITKLKEQRKKTPRYITFDKLPEEEKFDKLACGKKHFLDTIKMIAYRAETAIADIIRPQMVKEDQARTVIRQIFNRDVNLIPDEGNKSLNVELHNLSNEYEDNLARIICDSLNETETTFPGTDLIIHYKLVSEKNRRGQEV
jgi:hypothetical protein